MLQEIAQKPVKLSGFWGSVLLGGKELLIFGPDTCPVLMSLLRICKYLVTVKCSPSIIIMTYEVVENGLRGRGDG